jgi:hypothetical protein
MAQLTLQQKADMADSTSFKNRVHAQLLEKANYWKDFALTGSNGTADGAYNLRLQKRKKYALYLLSGAIPDLTAFSKFFLMQYDVDPASTTTIGSETQLTDSALDSAAFNVAFDQFAGVITGDENKGLDFSL